MRWFVVLPGALLPDPIAADVLAAVGDPALRELLQRAHAAGEARFDPEGAPHLAWLWQRFGGRGAPPTAPYALRALDPTADPNRHCWHADPVRFEFARDHFLVAAIEPPHGTHAEVLAADLRAALDEVGAAHTLHVHQGLWFLTAAQPWNLQASPLAAALGRSAQAHWPEGDDAAQWRRILNDVQMRWHQRHDADDRSLPNALWLHGGGVWAPLPVGAFAAVASDDPVLRGWALAAQAACTAPGDVAAAAVRRGDVLSQWTELQQAAAAEAWGVWLQALVPLARRLQQLRDDAFAAGFESLVLVLGGRRAVRQVQITSGDRWRLWRRPSLRALLSEREIAA